MFDVSPFFKINPTRACENGSGICSSSHQCSKALLMISKFSSFSSFMNSMEISSSWIGPGPGAFLLFDFLRYALISNTVLHRKHYAYAFDAAKLIAREDVLTTQNCMVRLAIGVSRQTRVPEKRSAKTLPTEFIPCVRYCCVIS